MAFAPKLGLPPFGTMKAVLTRPRQRAVVRDLVAIARVRVDVGGSQSDWGGVLAEGWGEGMTTPGDGLMRKLLI